MVSVANKLGQHPLALTTPYAAADAPTCPHRTHKTNDCSRPNTSADIFAHFCPITFKVANLLDRLAHLSAVTLALHVRCVLRTLGSSSTHVFT